MKRIEFLRTGILAGLATFIPFKGKTTESLPFVKKNPVITFTVEILKKYNVGIWLIQDDADVVTNPSYAATVVWKLVYNMGNFKHVNSERTKFGIPRYGRCNVFTDGWTDFICDNKEELCDYLNNNPYGKKFRIMTPDELHYLTDNKPNSKQNVRYI